MTVGDVLAALRARPAAVRCDELTSMLGALGFVVREGSSGGHRRYQHQNVKTSEGTPLMGSFDGGHGRNSVVNINYVRKAIKLIEWYEEELQVYLHGKSGGGGT